MNIFSPLLIIPKLISQPTWGGSRILEFQNWEKHFEGREIKIGQSYQLYGNSKFSTVATDTTSPEFIPEVGGPDGPQEHPDFTLDPSTYSSLDTVMQDSPEDVVGPFVWKKFGKMPLLNKLNDSSGNSFQLHIRPGQKHERWVSKAESWYYLDDGIATYGLNPETDIDVYKEVCKKVEQKMHDLSRAVISGRRSLKIARDDAKAFIKDLNPLQYVNRHVVKKHELLDLSSGGVHHSWEADEKGSIKSNFLYEVQQDVMDPVCTVRSFDQGKIKEDGSIREIHIDDYFELIDKDPSHNDVSFALKPVENNNNSLINSLLKTENYSIDLIEIKEDESFEDEIKDSFVHLFVRDGDVVVSTKSGEVRITQGHSAFIPYATGSYNLKSKTSVSAVIKTYIENSDTRI
ncbi:MAG: hypothetical protein ACMG6E_04760 [Candidatus Roizmanbacteria bacterium]